MDEELQREMAKRYIRGEGIVELAGEYGLPEMEVYEILCEQLKNPDNFDLKGRRREQEG